MIEQLRLERDKKYLVGVSGGSDSMGLLSMLIEQKYHVVVCTVNYKLRENADKEEQIVKDYCAKHSLDCYSYYPKQTKKGNFQKWAREARYDFYYQIYTKENCDYLLLAHQKDDYLENYLMALERKSHGWFYGIEEYGYHHNMKIIRPLLAYRKLEIREYCLANQIPFGDDESNFSDKYTRNRIRHHLVEQASQKEISKWCHEIEEFNNTQLLKLQQFKMMYPDNSCSLDCYSKQDSQTRKDLLRYFIYNVNPNGSYSGEFITEIDRQICSCKKSLVVSISTNYDLVCQYGQISLCKKREDYCYQIESLTYQTYPNFILAKQGKLIEGLTVTKDDFPIKIRNYKDSDTIKLRFGNKKVNRILIDKKVSYQDRNNWLVIENKNGTIIYVEKVGCDIEHYSTNMNLFVLKS